MGNARQETPVEVEGTMEIRLLDEKSDIWFVSVGGRSFDVTGKENVAACINVNFTSPLAKMLKKFHSTEFNKHDATFIIYAPVPGRPFWATTTGSTKDYNADVPWSKSMKSPETLGALT